VLGVQEWPEARSTQRTSGGEGFKEKITWRIAVLEKLQELQNEKIGIVPLIFKSTIVCREVTCISIFLLRRPKERPKKPMRGPMFLVLSPGN
jgi:hypothetical protein